MRIFVGVVLGASLSCGGGDDGVTVSGSVRGDAIGEDAEAIAVHRLANTQLSPGGETLDLYFADGGLLSACPDIGEPTDQSLLTLSLHAPEIRPTTFQFCEGFDCAGPSFDSLGEGWQLPDGTVVDFTGGSVALDSFDGERAAGSFTLQFDGDEITGAFDLAIECADSRPGQ